MDKKVQNRAALVSVIVPVYQVEKRIERCINSLREQTFTSFEVILVDDGSKDASGIICDKIAEIDNRFIVIHKDNGGVASAKQKGLEVAQGDYFIYVDSDDWVERSMLEELYDFAINKHADMVICDYFEKRENGEWYINQNPYTSDTTKILTDMFSGAIHGGNWNKLIKRSLTVIHNISFPPYPTMNEDTYFNTAILLHPISVFYLNKAFYHYDRTNENSVTRPGNSQTGLLSYQACQSFRVLLTDNVDIWKLFVSEEMPWMAYLTLYYGSVSEKQFKIQYKELMSITAVSLREKIVLWALKYNYKVIRGVIECYRLGKGIYCRGKSIISKCRIVF